MHGVAQFGIQPAFQFLEENPDAAREHLEIAPPVRIHPIESHVVIYTLRLGP